MSDRRPCCSTTSRSPSHVCPFRLERSTENDSQITNLEENSVIGQFRNFLPSPKWNYSSGLIPLGLLIAKYHLLEPISKAPENVLMAIWITRSKATWRRKEYQASGDPFKSRPCTPGYMHLFWRDCSLRTCPGRTSGTTWLEPEQ